MIINTKIVSLILLVGFLLFSSGCIFRSNKTYQKLTRTLESGNQAFQVKQYDKAIEYYDAGLRISPQELALLNNKSSALRMRGIELYNDSIRLTDKEAKTTGIETAKKDFYASSLISSKAVQILKTTPDTKVFILESIGSLKSQTLEIHAESMRILATYVDKTKGEDALIAMHEYIDVETDKMKRLKTQLIIGKMLIDTNNGKKAVIEYKNVLEINPDNLDAILGLGLALAQSGEPDDLQEAKTFLQDFVDKAPQDHPSMTVAREILNTN